MEKINYFELILGAVLGVIVTEIYERFFINFLNKIRKKMFLKKRLNLYQDKKIRNFIINYYSKQGSLAELYDCEIQGYSKKILFLTNEFWSNLDIDVLNSNSLIKVVDGPSLEFKINNKMIKERQWAGQTIFDEPALYLSRVSLQNQIEAKCCSFFQKLTLIDNFEKETYKSSRSVFKKRPKLRNKILSSFNAAVFNNTYPISMGCHVIFSIKYKNDIYIALQQRSNKTFTYGGYYATVPVFGLVPIPKSDLSTTHDALHKNILLYNIIKEYCEEVFNISDLEHNKTHADPLWFYQEEDEAKDLIDSLKKQSTICKVLGFGFDAINSLSIFSVLLYVDDEKLSENIYKLCNSNWEIEEGIKFYQSNNEQFKMLLEQELLQNGTAFSLSLALKYINEHIK